MPDSHCTPCSPRTSVQIASSPAERETWWCSERQRHIHHLACIGQGRWGRSRRTVRDLPTHLSAPRSSRLAGSAVYAIYLPRAPWARTSGACYAGAAVALLAGKAG